MTEEVALLAALQEADQDIEQGRLVSNEEMKERVKEWTGG